MQPPAAAYKWVNTGKAAVEFGQGREFLNKGKKIAGRVRRMDS